jgi:dTDP-4-dehydrorhamnose 3,5-epimerase
VEGKIFDVCLDLRKNSKTFGKKFINILKKGDTIFIPKGFAHGFEALKNNCLVFYQFSEYRDKKSEISISYNDPNLGIKWITNRPILSKKDKKAINFNEFKIRFPIGI